MENRQQPPADRLNAGNCAFLSWSPRCLGGNRGVTGRPGCAYQRTQVSETSPSPALRDSPQRTPEEVRLHRGQRGRGRETAVGSRVAPLIQQRPQVSEASSTVRLLNITAQSRGRKPAGPRPDGHGSVRFSPQARGDEKRPSLPTGYDRSDSAIARVCASKELSLER